MNSNSESTRLPVIQIPSPCPKQWSELAGGDQLRYCDLCTKHVYNFYEMPAAEIEAVLKSNENVCAQIRKRPDGSILTAEDKPIHKTNRFLKPFAMLAASLITLITFGGCESETVSRLLPWLPTKEAPDPVLGDLVVAQPVGGEIMVEEEVGLICVEPEPDSIPEPPIVEKLSDPSDQN